MIGLDTNVLIRFLIDVDDSDQSIRARKYVLSNCTPEEPGFVNAIVLCETAWVLRSLYAFATHKILDVIDDLLDAEGIEVENRRLVAAALDISRRHNVGFADAYLALRNEASGRGTTVTFDKRCLRLPQFSEP